MMPTSHPTILKECYFRMRPFHSFSPLSKKLLQRFCAITAFLFLFSGVFANSALSEESTAAPCSYTPQTLQYREADAQFALSREVLVTETAFARYHFDLLIDEAQRQRCMDATDQILAALVEQADKPDIYIFPRKIFSGVNIMGHTLYTAVADWNSVDYVTNVLLAASGEGSHYGLAFGAACLLCQQLGWESSALSSPAVLDASDVLDLNLLCFDARFASESDIAAAQSLAREFAVAFSAAHGQEALQNLLFSSTTASGMVQLSQTLSDWYAEQGIVYSPTTLRFGYGGISYDYMVQSECAAFYIGTDWVDANRAVNPLVSEHFLHENYAQTKAFFECTVQQMGDYQALFALDSNTPSLTVLFPNASGQTSFYRTNTHTIHLFNVDSLMHETIHALTQPQTSQPLWQVEGFARFFSYYYDAYGLAFLNADYNAATFSAETQYLFEYKATLDRPIDIMTDFRALENVAVYSRGYTNPNASYVAGSSFVQYLVDLYGEDAVIQSIYGDGRELPASYNELVAGWNQRINESCEGYYSRYGR